MKRFLLPAILFALAFALAGCSSGGSGSDSKSITLTERLAAAKDGDTIDISAENIIVDATEYVISKSVTIKNGALDGVTFKIDTEDSSSRALSGSTDDLVVLFEKLTGLKLVDVISGGNVSIQSSVVENVVVSENATDASVSVSSVTVQKLDVKANGVVISVYSAQVDTLNLDEDANVSLCGSTKVAKLTVKDEFGGFITKTSTTVVEEAVSVSGEDIMSSIKRGTEVSDAEVLLNEEITGGVLKSVRYCNSALLSETVTKWITPSEATGEFSAQFYKTTAMWDSWFVAVDITKDLQVGKNYKITFKLKTSENAVLRPQFSVDSGYRNAIAVHSKKDEWTEVVLYSNMIKQAAKEFWIDFPMESYDGDVELTLKDFAIEELEADGASIYGFEPYVYTNGTGYMDEYIDMSCDSDGVVTVTVKKDNSELYGSCGGSIYCTPIEKEHLGKLLKASFEIWIENYSEGICMTTERWPYNTFGISWAWGRPENYDVQKWIPVNAYIFVSDDYIINGQNPCIKIWVEDRTSTTNTIKVRNYKYEVCTDAPMKAWYANMEPWTPCELYGEYYDEEYYIKGIKIPAGRTVCGEIKLTHESIDNPYDTAFIDDNLFVFNTNHVAYDVDAVPAGLEIEPYGVNGYVLFTNTTSVDMYINISVDNKTGLINLEQVTEPEDEKLYGNIYAEPSNLLYVVGLAEDDGKYIEPCSLEYINGIAERDFTYSSEKFKSDDDNADVLIYLTTSFSEWREFDYYSSGYLTPGKTIVANTEWKNRNSGFYLSGLTEGESYTLVFKWKPDDLAVEVSLKEKSAVDSFF